MLPESRLYNFIDNKNGFSISFLEGQKLIEDLVVIHNFKQVGFSFFRDSVLNAVQLINYLKPEENFGFFVDSQIPYFRLKIEMNYNGYLRTILLPAEFNENPDIFSGNVRLTKIMPNSNAPYNSIIEVKGKGLKDIVNLVLKDSYQIQSKVILSDVSDQSILISKLPNVNINKTEVDERINLDDYFKKIESQIHNIFAGAHTDFATLEKEFKDLGFEYLMGKDIIFKCNCSRDRMLMGVASVVGSHSVEEVFDNKDSLEAKCDYCNTNYLITKKEIEEVLKLSKKH